MTASNRDEAERIAGSLVETRLAACVQIIPEIHSVYRWQGEIARDQEVLLLAKTTVEMFRALEQEVRELHSYETPEIVAVKSIAVSEPYRSWLLENIGRKISDSPPQG
jgi:periplasmic divalent cation tolerance protein